MIEITRSLARQLRAVFRKALPLGWGRGPRPSLVFHAGKDGLRVQSHHPEVAVELHQPGARPVEVIALPSDALDDFEGRRDEVVTLENVEQGSVQARWDDGGLPQVRDYHAPEMEKLSAFPEEPRKLIPVDASILKALDDAVQTVARETARYTLQKIQLRGSSGEIIATDGKQLLVQGGFALPWKEDALVPATSVFACKELSQEKTIHLGKTDTHVCIRIGSWAFFLSINKDGRFPDAKSVIPRGSAGVTVCQLAPEDGEFLLRALPRLPGRDDDSAPLTLDLNGHFAVRVKGEGQSRPTEVVLARSQVVGPAVRCASNRQYLARAVALGFTELRIAKPDVPVVASDGQRTYLWMPFDKAGILPPSDDALRITSSGDESATQPPKNERSKETMPRHSTHANGNGHSNGQDHDQAPLPPDRRRTTDLTTKGGGTGLGSLIAEAQSLKEALHDAYSRSRRLLAALKRQKKQQKLMATTLASLKQLQQIEG